MPRFQVFEKNKIHQADLLFLPHDGQYKYALVIVDIFDGECNARPLKNKTSKEVLAAFKSIYEEKSHLTMPKMIHVDAGTEFKGDVKKYFNSKKVIIRVGMTGRHRQQAIVERKNQQLGVLLFKRMVGQELLTGVTSKEWVKFLPRAIKVLNKKLKPKREKDFPNIPVCSGDSCQLLEIGQKVRIQLDNPIEATENEKKLSGRFRSTDIKWNTEPRKIKSIILKPGYPPLYYVSGIDKAMFTRNQLQVIPKNEQLPLKKVIEGKPEMYKVEAILKKRTEPKTKKVFYKVKWLGFKSSKYDTWEPAVTLKEDVPDMVKQFEKKNNK